MKEPIASSAENDLESEHESPFAIGSFLGIIVATAVFYFAKSILLPVTMAAMLAVIFSPIASRLENYLGRVVGAALVVVATVIATTAVAYFLTTQLTSVAVQVADYSSNIAAKISSIEKSTPVWLERIDEGVADVQHRLEREKERAASRAAKATKLATQPSEGADLLKQVPPIVASIGEAALVITLFFFVLYSRTDLRNRVVRLAVRSGITVAPQALESAGAAVGRYLLLFSLVNFGFGLVVTAMMWVLGLPSPELWGMLAFLLRFVPYVGALASAVMPMLVAFAIFPGLSRSFEVLGCFVILDQVAAQFVEPVLIGRGIGVSPAALLIATMYWTWLWGMPGLLLATPLTACLKVAGDYIPPLGFLAILLGANNGPDEYHEYYRKFVELDGPGARAIAVQYCDARGLESTFDDLIIPAIMMMGTDAEQGNISEHNQEFVVETTRKIIAELGERLEKPWTSPRLGVLGLGAPGEAHFFGLMMLLEVLRQDGAAATLLNENESARGAREFIRRHAPDLVCLSCSTAACVAAAVDLVRDLKTDSPRLTIVAGGVAAVTARAQFLSAGCWAIFDSRRAARRAISRFAMRLTRERSYLGGQATSGASERRLFRQRST